MYRSKPPLNALLTVTITLLLVTGIIRNANAEGVTIGGTTHEGEAKAAGFGLFTGDLFDNFRNMQRFVPVAEMQPGKHTWNLGENANTLRYRGDFLGKPMSLEDFITYSDTSALLVIHKGRIIYEHYAHGDTPESLHASFSLAKSFVSAALGIAIAEGFIDSVDDPVRKYLPALTSPTFDDVTIAQVLQMSSGIRFNENYQDPDSDINRLGVLTRSMSFIDYINTLERERPPGTYNHYASINTQLLGILLVEATGQPLTKYMQEKLWQPLGMQDKGLWTLDAQGYELALGGLAASARDYAKLGLLYLQKGRREDQQIVPEQWVTTSVTPTLPHLLPGENKASSNTSGYNYQWWTPRYWDGDFLARGIWGQAIYVHPGNEVVIVKLAADKKNFDLQIRLAYIDYLQALAQSLSTEGSTNASQ